MMGREEARMRQRTEKEINGMKETGQQEKRHISAFTVSSARIVLLVV